MKKVFEKNEPYGDELFNHLNRLCDGLVYLSETDSPVMPFLGSVADEVSLENLLTQVPAEDGVEVKVLGLEEFFGRLTALHDWQSEEEKKRAETFRELYDLFTKHLRQGKVFRLGTVKLDIYAVGLGPDGRLMGISTKAVET